MQKENNGMESTISKIELLDSNTSEPNKALQHMI
jgi:hypothetical protein